MDAQVPMVKAKSTVQDWLDYPYTGGYVELIEGELIVAGGASPKHQDVSYGFEQLLDQLKPNGVIRHAPVGVWLDEDNIPEPDIFWVAEGSACHRGERCWIGAPDLIVEILSRSTARHDWHDKFYLYERFGVREYWIVDPLEQVVHPFTLHEGKYQPIGTFGVGESFMSPALGEDVARVDVFAA